MSTDTDRQQVAGTVLTTSRSPLDTLLRVLGCVALVMAIVVMAAGLYYGYQARTAVLDAQQAISDFEVPSFDTPVAPTLDVAPEPEPEPAGFGPGDPRCIPGYPFSPVGTPGTAGYESAESQRAEASRECPG